MPKRRRRNSSEDKNEAKDGIVIKDDTNGSRDEIQVRSEDLIRRIQNGDDRAVALYTTILNKIEGKIMKELDSDTLDSMVRLLTVCVINHLPSLIFFSSSQKLDALKRESKTKEALLSKHGKALSKWIEIFEGLSDS